MRGFEILKNGAMPMRIGVEDSLPIVIFAVDGRGHSDFHATVTEYENGDRYRYAFEDMVPGDEFEISYTAFDEPSAPVALEHKGAAPLRRRVVEGDSAAASSGEASAGAGMASADPSSGVVSADEDAGMAAMDALRVDGNEALHGSEHSSATPALEVSLNGQAVRSSLPGSVLISFEQAGLQVSYAVFTDDGAMHSLLKAPLRPGDVLRVRFGA